MIEEPDILGGKRWPRPKRYWWIHRILCRLGLHVEDPRFALRVAPLWAPGETRCHYCWKHGRNG